jgi:two-component system sensor histidine kinase CpxA
MKWITWFNPAKSLFLRVFLGFWLAALIIFIVSAWLVKQLDSAPKYLPLNGQQQEELSSVSRRLQTHLNRRDDNVKIRRLLTQWSKRNRFGLVLVNLQTRDVLYSNTRQRRIKETMLDSFDVQSTPLLIEYEGSAFIGPARLQIEKSRYLLFINAPRPGGILRIVRHEYPVLFVLLMLTLSGGFCYLFVRGLLNPMTQLSQASKRMASGELGVRIENASLRLDEIGQLGRDFNHMSEQVESLIIGQKRLLADISHELRSPLARLQLAIGIAQQENQSNVSESILKALDRIEKESLQIEDMIGQVLLLSRLDNQQPIQQLQAVDLVQLMAPIIADARFEAEQKNKILHYKEAQDVCFQADSHLLASAIENVLRNAIHYSRSEIDLSIVVTAQNIVWTISDDGDGCSEEQLNKIFDAFYRESKARDRNSGGVGLGLAIAQGAVAKHRGIITAKNHSAGGLLVVISIPFIRA